MKIKRLKDTHPTIYTRILHCQAIQGNKPDDTLDLRDTGWDGNFNWHLTEEGVDVWEKVVEGDFDAYYSHHNLKPKTIKVYNEPIPLKTKILQQAPNTLRLMAIIYVFIQAKTIFHEHNLLWIAPLTLFGISELIDIILEYKKTKD